MKHDGSTEDEIAVAGVVYDGKFDVDAVLSAAVELLRSNGLRVGGLLQHFGETLSNGKRAMYVEDLSNGERIRLDIPRGKEAAGCTLDPDGLNRASCALKNAIAQRPDVLIINRFGKQEAEGHGMRAELAEAVSSGVPTVVAVSQNLIADWDKFVGEPGHVLKPQPQDILNWSRQQLRSESAVRRSA